MIDWLSTVVVRLLNMDVRIVDASEGGRILTAEDPGGPVHRVWCKVGSESLDRGWGRDVAAGIGKAVVSEDSVDGPKERVVLAAAPVGEVVEVQSPEEGIHILAFRTSLILSIKTLFKYGVPF